MTTSAQGPLAGVRVVEFGGMGPGSFAAMMLSDMGASVTRVERPNTDQAMTVPRQTQFMLRNRRSVSIDLSQEVGKLLARDLIGAADAVIEGFRPGVMERLGLGPSECLAINGQLIYCRVTGWGRDGELSRTAGHDINYLAVSGALHALGDSSAPPSPPLALLGDMAGGGLHLVAGLSAALFERARSKRGQVIDVSIVDGVRNMLTSVYGNLAGGRWQDIRGQNLLDGGAPYYRTYECADGRYVAVGALEDRFFRILAQMLNLGEDLIRDRRDPASWEKLREALTVAFRQRSRDHWWAYFEGSDACVSPVLSLTEARDFAMRLAEPVLVGGHVVPPPAPHFSRTPGAVQRPPSPPGSDSAAVLSELGVSPSRFRQLLAEGAVRLPQHPRTKEENCDV